MYYSLLKVHSLFRWLVLISLIYSVIHNYRGYKKKRPFNKRDHLLRATTATIVYVQISLGLWLYFISPFVSQFYHNMSKGIHLREVRFFAMEHSLMMLVSAIVMTLGSWKAKRQLSDTLKFKTVYVWYLIALIIILLNIPWEFSPLVNRPSFRS